MDSIDLSSAFPASQLQEMKLAIEKGDLLQAAEDMKRSFLSSDAMPLNIAVTGDPGSGKSTFINVLRGLGDEDKGSAKTGVVETTMVAQPYLHPQHRNVTYWDLPGIGAPCFQPRQYLELVGFHQFDFFIIITSGRFRDCHIQVARAITATGKRFYFVRNKIDVDLTASRRFRRSHYDEDQILEMIRTNCIEGLYDGGIGCPPVFLISCLELEKYDFDLLQRTLESDLPGHKRYVFLLSSPNVCLQILERKKDAFKNQIWKHALVSAGYALLSMVNLSANGDLDRLVDIMKGYKEAFGLDQRSLHCLAKTFHVDVHDLSSVVQSRLVFQEITRDLVVNLIHREELIKGARMVMEYVAGERPLIGSLVDGGVAFGTAYWLLYSFLKDMADDACRVLRRAFDSMR